MFFLSLLALFHLFWPRQGSLGPVFCVWRCFHKRSDSVIKPWHYLDEVLFWFVALHRTFCPLHTITLDFNGGHHSAHLVFDCWTLLISQLEREVKLHSLHLSNSSWFYSSHLTQTLRTDYMFCQSAPPLLPKKQKLFCGQRQCPLSLRKSIDPLTVKERGDRRWVTIKAGSPLFSKMPQKSLFHSARRLFFTWVATWTGGYV